MMGFSRFVPLTARKLTWRAPDYREVRGDQALLVWGDTPYWTVAPLELEPLLQNLDGDSKLDDVVSQRPEWLAQKQDILESLQVLHNGSVFSPTPNHAPEPPLYGTKIENVALNITNRCNLRCKFCYNIPFLTNDASDEVTADEVVSFLKQIRGFLGKSPTLTILGGEPLMDAEKLLKVSAAGAKLGLTVLVSTNGTRVTDDFAREATNLKMQMQVSLDGHTAARNDAIRGKGSFEKAVEGVRTLVRGGAHTTISMVCHRGNIDHLEDFFALAQKLEVNEARFIPLKRIGGAAGGDMQPVPLDELLGRAFEIFKKHPEYLKLAGRDAFSILANTCRYSTRRVSCGTGLQTVLLDADGSLYPCLNTNNPCFRFANVRDAGFDFAKVWMKSPELQRIREKTVLQRQMLEHADCPVRYWCLGGCSGENYVLTGALDKRPPHCAQLRRAILDMFWMLAERPDMVKPTVKGC